MSLWSRRRHPTLAEPRANSTRIAVLEHDLLGIAPPPGSAASAVIALRKAGTCMQHRPIDTSHLSDRPGSRAICAGCGHEMRQTQDGAWFVIRQPGIADYWAEEA